MNQLPDELLNNIFFFLHQEDKVECMTVCHHWKEIIATSSLFNTVRISSKGGLHKVIKKLMDEPNQAARVERLLIDIYSRRYVSEGDLNDLLLLLPNLRAFFILDSNSELDLYDELSYPFHKSIERVIEYSRKSTLNSILQDNICLNLTTLCYSQNGNKEVYPLLKNAPNLRTLNLYFGMMDLMDFETIHENAPSLTSLSVNMITIDNATIIHNIIPASLITKLVIGRLSRIETITTTGLLPYIDKKYPNLKRFVYDVSMAFRPGTNDCLDTLLQTIKPSLGSLSIISYSQPKKQCRFLEDDTWISSHLPELKLSTPSSPLLDQAVFSNVIQVIQSLKLLKVTTDTFRGLKNFTSLRKLKLVFSTIKRKDSEAGEDIEDKKKIKFQDILDSCPPSLKSLYLKSVEIESDFHDTSQYPLESLTFDHVDLPLNMDAFISSHFTKLSTFRLKGCGLKGREFVLPNIDLYRFQFETFGSSDLDTVLVSTFKNNKSRYYTFKKKSRHLRLYSPEVGNFDDPIYLPVKSSPEIKPGTVPYFTLVCNSVTNVELRPAIHKHI